MRAVVTDDVGQVKLGGLLLPGVFQSIEVVGALRIDQPQVEGQSSSPKQILGYDDATITLRLLLLTDDDSTAYDKLKVMAGLFKSVDKAAKPYVYRLVNKHCAAWGITDVIFKGAQSSDDNQRDTVQMQLDFCEYKPVVVKQEAIVNTQDGETGTPPSTSPTSPSDQTGDVPPKAKTPAVDDAAVPSWGGRVYAN